MREEEILQSIQYVQTINEQVVLVGSKKSLSSLPTHIEVNKPVNKPSDGSYLAVWNGYRCIALDADLLDGGDERIYILPVPFITPETVLAHYINVKDIE